MKIVNGHHTGREIGSPITDLGLRMWSTFEKTGEVSPKSYFTNAADGSLLKSTTCILAGPEQKPIGMLCINMNLSFPFPEIVKTLMPQCHVSQTLVSETFSNNANDVIKQALSAATQEVDQAHRCTLRTSEPSIMYSYVRLSIDRCTLRTLSIDPMYSYVASVRLSHRSCTATYV